MPLVSNNALQAALSGWTSEVFLECITINHASMGSPLRLVNDRQDLVRSAGTFTAFPFEVRLHAQADDRITEGELVADNTDRRIVQALRSLTGSRPTVMYEVVLASSPNTVEVGPITYEALAFRATLADVTLTIAFAFSILNDAYPKDYFAPWNASGGA